MKRFFLLVYICLSCLVAQAQAVTDGVFVSGDIVSFSYDSDPWVQYDFRYHLSPHFFLVKRGREGKRQKFSE